jgi:YHS domain-containing protein
MKNHTTVERKSERELVVTRTYNGPARIVFEAWTRPELFMRWWVPKSMGMSLLSCEMDVRVGGKYRLEFAHGDSRAPLQSSPRCSFVPDQNGTLGGEVLMRIRTSSDWEQEMRRILCEFGHDVRIALATLLLLAATSAGAGEYFVKEGVALRGYDPVSYFTGGEPQKGKPEHSFEYGGTKFLFASAENRKAFAENPEKYAPQFGGYCAYGASNGYKVSTQPDAFAIVNGKLYLNYNRDVLEMWKKDPPTFIERAEEKWPETSKTEPKD